MYKGLFFAVLASFLFSAMNASAKFLAESMSVAEIVFYRGVIGVSLTLIFMRSSGENFVVKNWYLLISRGLFGAGSLLLAFYTISKIALAEASFIAHLSPLITVVLASVILKEKMPKGSGFVVLLSLFGAFLVSSPWQANLQLYYVSIGVIGALLASSASVAIRQLSKDHNNFTIMLAFLTVATFLPMPFIEWSQMTLPIGKTAIFVLFLGAVSFVAQYCLTQAYRLEKAGMVATTRYIGIFFNIALGYFIWAEVPPWTSFLGGFIIVLSCIILPLLKKRES